ncbi:MAG: RNA polymerase sigma factor [Pseudomonadota bacterium]
MRGEKNTQTAVRQGLRRHLRAIWRYGYALSGSPDRADDLAQATCVRALERHHQVSSTERLDAWFLTICRSIWLNELRAQSVRRAQSLDTTPEAEMPQIAASAEVNIFAREVLTEVMGLPEAQRDVVMLVFVEGYSYREAADILSVPLGTVMSRLHAARAKLRHLAAADTKRHAGQRRQ